METVMGIYVHNIKSLFVPEDHPQHGMLVLFHRHAGTDVHASYKG